MIGRKDAASGGTALAAQDLCTGAANDQDSSSCADSGFDHSYRIFLRRNEALHVTVSGTPCKLGSALASIKVHQAASGCEAPAVTSCAESQPLVACESKGAQVVAPEDGWYVIVVDGNTPGDGVVYDLTVALDPVTCAKQGCECPLRNARLRLSSRSRLGRSSAASGGAHPGPPPGRSPVVRPT